MSNKAHVIKNIKKLLADNEKKLVLLYPFYNKTEKINTDDIKDEQDAMRVDMFFSSIRYSQKPLIKAIDESIKMVLSSKSADMSGVIAVYNKLVEIFSRPMPQNVELVDKVKKVKKEKRQIDPDHTWLNYIKDHKEKTGEPFITMHDFARFELRIKYHLEYNSDKPLPASLKKLIPRYINNLSESIKTKLSKLENLSGKEDKPKKKKIVEKKTTIIEEPLMGTINIVKKAPAKNTIQTMLNQQNKNTAQKIEKLIDDINKKNISTPDTLDAGEVENLFKMGNKLIKSSKKENKIADSSIETTMAEIDDLMKKIHEIINVSYRNNYIIKLNKIKDLLEQISKNNLINNISDAMPKKYTPKSSDYSKYDKYKTISSDVEVVKGEPHVKRAILAYQIHNITNSLMEKKNNPNTTKEEIKQLKKAIKFYDNELLKLTE
jgi:hypothetical protein